ncbi:ankyrin repeat domain-containing protein 22-like [Epargyreus clarus]|uniref:ankyrin repeat domain-containing protein 22-like n=1 Tax=Epargyreus clarus TaxID=520877 RepID=UPI003C2E92B6
MNWKMKKPTLGRTLSESSLDVHIPSFPGSPRSLNIGSASSLQSIESHDPFFVEAVEFLHEDKDFLIAAETGNHKILDILIRRGTNIQQKDHLGRNALHLAVCSDSEAAVMLLLKTGIKTNVKDNLGMTALSLCLMRRPSYNIANRLFDHGAEIVPRSNPVDTGLFLQFVMMCTPTTKDAEILKLLVKKGAVVNDPEAPGGRQALHFAAMSNNCRLIDILVELGADLFLTNHRNETPKDVAETFKCKEAFELLSELEEQEDSDVSLSLQNSK